ncbi:MAG: sigma-70 family RNA polymerase sigma factor [Phycisphaerae bacterium]|jgi:DNA-directed RNA polymerase specialized sigma24 family protein|nr:sigma-70 family RNA polymerase sigma factor [Phycisphaerae bacterium]
MDESDLEALQPDLERILSGDDDARQDLNAKLWQRRHSITNPRHYALRAGKLCRAGYRRSPRRATAALGEAHNLADRSLSPLDQLIRKEECSRVRQEIDALPGRQREAALAFLYSEARGARTRAERKHLCKAKKKLRHLLRDQETT